MHESLLPLFPLRIVLLPGAPLPLHIFEDRYKEMITEVMRTGGEFGIVQAGDRGILNIGCTATVKEVVNRYADGRLDIVSLGRRRFEIIMLDEQKSYLRASVSFFDDDQQDPPPVELRAIALAGMKILSESGEEASEPEAATQLSFQVGQLIPDLDLRQLLLSLRSETDRLKQLASFLPEYLAKLKRIDHVKRVAPTNGHGMISLGDTE